MTEFSKPHQTLKHIKNRMGNRQKPSHRKNVKRIVGDLGQQYEQQRKRMSDFPIQPVTVQSNDG